MSEFQECYIAFIVKVPDTDIYDRFTCALGSGHEDEYHWDPRGFNWKPFMPPPTTIG